MRNLYEVLGVAQDATPAIIKRAYKKLAMKHHPDRGGDAETFKEIQTAYDTLSDTDRRAHYDSTGSTAQVEDELTRDIKECIMQVVSGTMENDDDPIAAAYLFFEARFEQTRQSVTAQHKKMTKLRRKMARLRPQTDDNLFIQVGRAKVADCEEFVKNAEHAKLVLEGARKAIAHYSCVAASREENQLVSSAGIAGMFEQAMRRG